jgi:hypothetical protein
MTNMNETLIKVTTVMDFIKSDIERLKKQMESN